MYQWTYNWLLYPLLLRKRLVIRLTSSQYFCGSTNTKVFSPLNTQFMLSTASVWTTDLVPPSLNHITCFAKHTPSIHVKSQNRNRVLENESNSRLEEIHTASTKWSFMMSLHCNDHGIMTSSLEKKQTNFFLFSRKTRLGGGASSADWFWFVLHNWALSLCRDPASKTTLASVI